MAVCYDLFAKLFSIVAYAVREASENTRFLQDGPIQVSH